jgi:hypothetical protein
MVKCPFCHFENEDGALFCEQCKSDLAPPGGADPVVMAHPVSGEGPPVAVAEAVPVAPEAAGAVLAAEAIPLEAVPVAGLPAADAIPLAAEWPPPSEAPTIALEPINAPEAASAPPATPAAPEPAPELAPEPAPEPAPVMAAPAPAASAAPTPPPAAAPAPAALPPGAQPRLLVLRGQKRNVEYPIYDGLNFIGRADEKPVDIDLEDQEPPDRIWCSRQHACISFENDQLAIEDLNSSNGTYVNRTRVYPGQRRPLSVNDIVQIGNVQLKVIA